MAGGMTEVARATVTIVPNMKGSQATIAKELGASTESAGEKAGSLFGKNLIGTVKKVLAVVSVGKLIGDSLNAGADLQQSFGGLETLYGDAASAAKEYAYEAASAGISANDYAEQAVSFGASLKAAFGGDTAKAAEAANTAIMDMADNAAKMGTPLESIQNAYQGFAKGQYNMLDNLKLGYGGTKEEMERLLSDASKLSGQEYDLSNLGDVYDAIHVIQEDLGLTGVAADEAATTFSGSLGAMKAAAQNVLANLALGENITADLKNLGASVKTFVVGNVMPMVANIAKQAPAVLAQIPTFIADMAPDFIAGAADIVSNLATGLIDNIPTFIAGVGTLLQSLWTGITNIDWSAAGQLVVTLLSTAWEGLKTAASAIWDTVVGVFTGEIEFPDISEAAKTVWNALTTKASEVWTAVKTWFTKTFTWPNISDAAKIVWNKLTTVASEIWTAIKTWFTKTFKWPDISEAAKQVWNKLTTAASTIWNAVKTWFTKTFTFPSLVEMAKKAWNGLTTLASTIWTAIKTWFQKTFQFPSLTKLAYTAWSGLTTLASTIWESVIGFFSSAISIPSLDSAARTAWNTLSGVASTIWDGVASVFSSIEIEWPDFGEMAKGALEGLKTAAKNVWDWVKGLFSGDEDNEAVQSVKGSTSEMATALADAELQISAVDVSSIQTANEFVKQTVLGWIRIFKNLSLKIPTVGTKSLTAALKAVTDMTNNYKEKMKFTWTLPTLHGYLPVISVNMKEAKSSDGKTSVSYPELSKSSVKWFAEGGVFKNPTIIGIGDSKGPEAAVPLDKMWRQMDKEFDRHMNGGNIYQTYNIDGATDPEAFAMSVARTIKRELRMA